MASNLNELKLILPRLITQELIQQTLDRTYEWTVVSVDEYTAVVGDYSLNLTGAELRFDLDGEPFRTYAASDVDDVLDLFHTVYEIYSGLSDSDDLIDLVDLVQDVEEPIPPESNVYNQIVSGGIGMSGGSVVSKLSPVSATLLPVSLSFGPATYSWTGTVDDISQTPSISNVTYIRQEVKGPSPTYWGYAIASFDVSGLSSWVNVATSIRISRQNEATDNTALFVDLVANNAVYYTSGYFSGTAAIVSVGVTTSLEGLTGLTTLQARMYLYTNAGNSEPRAIRISGLEIQVTGLV